MDDPKAPQETVAPVPFAVYEAALAHASAANRRIFRLLIALLAAFVAINIAWLYAWMQYDYVSDTVTIESTAGHANFIGANGDIYNGQDHGQEAGPNP